MTKSRTPSPFDRQKDDKRKPLTHEQIAHDLDAFKHAGGKIEVLGNTLMLRTIPLSAMHGAAVPVQPEPPATKRPERAAEPAPETRPADNDEDEIQDPPG